MFNEKKFFDAARKNVFQGSLSQSQVDGLKAILNSCIANSVTDLRQIASVMATPILETGGTYVPVTENLNYRANVLAQKFGKRITTAQANQYGRIPPRQAANQEAIANIIYGGEFGLKQLGNKFAGDGWKYRGRGLVQITGRGNYEAFTKLLGIDLANRPELACELNTAASILVIGERDGIFTGARLSHFFNKEKSDWRNARKIVNGLDRAEDLAAASTKLFECLKVAA